MKTKGNKYLYLVLIAIIGTAFFVFNKNSYVEFRPTLFEGNTYHKFEVNDTFYRKLKLVLDYYKVKNKVSEDGKVMITRNVAADKDLLYNYTKKALDSSWLNSHQIITK
ncbi:hypothetical protein [Pinibacter soli]|uniref:Uncharacterized protein n=1 Tax=Pinibacter soli TaxID=3044211 RepID=A0ABT6R746_9BACT|nr:hypothetical protein [Pinibacter soli]MDI3318386.1 hypothetical protein [Pinibacter soli]